MAAERGPVWQCWQHITRWEQKKNPTHDCSIWSEILIFQLGKQVAARWRYFISLMCMLASSHRSAHHHVHAETPRAAANRHRILEAVVYSGKFQIKLCVQQIKDRLCNWTQLFRVNTDDLLGRSLNGIRDTIPDHTWDFISYRTGFSGVRWMAWSHFLMASQCLKETHGTENTSIYDQYQAITHFKQVQLIKDFLHATINTAFLLCISIPDQCTMDPGITANWL